MSRKKRMNNCVHNHITLGAANNLRESLHSCTNFIIIQSYNAQNLFVHLLYSAFTEFAECKCNRKQLSQLRSFIANTLPILLFTHRLNKIFKTGSISLTQPS